MAEGAALDHPRVAQSVHREAIPAVLAEPRSAKLLRSVFYWFVTMLLFATGSLVYLLAEKDESSTRVAKALHDPAVRYVATSPRVSPARPTPSTPREAAHVNSRLNSSHPKPPEQLRSPNSTTTTATTSTSTTETSILHQSPTSTSILLHQSSPETLSSTTVSAPQPERPSSARAASSSKKKLECTGTLMADGVSVSYRCR
jgi:hypothetical protein